MKKLIYLFLFSYNIIAFSQVGIGTTNPDSSSALDITSTDKGILIPRVNLLSTTDTTTISSPANSLLVYNLSTIADVVPGFYYWNGSSWLNLVTIRNPNWNIDGNAGTNPNLNFIGTTDNQDIVFKRNNILSGKLTTDNTSFGLNTLVSNTTGINNTALGINALFNNTTGNANTANGNDALLNNTIGNNNTASGYQTLKNNTIGNDNTASGASAMLNNISGNENTANGYLALQANTTGNGNTAIGAESLAASNGNYNTAIGKDALNSNTSGSFNTAAGASALALNLIGNYNTAIGYSALATTRGSNNIGIGYNAVVPNINGNNQVRIGNTSINYAGIQVAWTITSDKRWKNTITNSDLGLKFIQQLRPVSYFRNNDETKKLEYGFIAQEIQNALKENGATNSGIVSEDDAGMLGVRYNDLMAPMVKAIQEQQTQIETHNKWIADQKILIEQIQRKIDRLEKK